VNFEYCLKAVGDVLSDFHLGESMPEHTVENVAHRTVFNLGK